MIVKLIWSWTEVENLKTIVDRALVELAIDDAITVELSDDPAYKLELGITENPALCIEEESIEFKDVIFQWEVPEYEEIKSMFVSIFGDEEDHSHGEGGCGTGGCDSCGTGGCH